MSYHANGAMASMRLANGVSEAVTLDGRMRTTGITWAKSATNLLTLGYDYDPNGNVKTQRIANRF